MSLGIRGIAGGKHPTKRKGDYIELSTQEKLLRVSKERLASFSPEGHRYIPLEVKVEGDITFIPGRNLGKGKEDPNQYIGTVSIRYRSLRLKDSRLDQSREMKVTVHFKDCYNDLGLPDQELVDFKIIQ